MAALLKRTSKRPNFSPVAANKARIDSGWRTSVGRASMPPPGGSAMPGVARTPRTARPIPLPPPVTIATLPCPLTASFSSLFGIETIANVPMCRLSRRDHQVMVGFGANRGARRPKIEARNGVVSRLFDAHSRPRILDGDVVIRRIVGIARQITFHVLFWLQFLTVDDLLAFDLRLGSQRFFRLGFPGKADRHSRSAGSLVEHEKVVVVDLRVDGLRAGVFEAVVQREARLMGAERNRFLVR